MIDRVIHLSLHDRCETYVVQLPSGQLIADYDYDAFSAHAVDTETLRSGVQNSSIVEVVPVEDTPFEALHNGSVERAIKLEVFGHCDAFVVRLPSGHFVSDWDDPSIGCHITDPSNLRDSVQNALNVSVVSVVGTPFAELHPELYE